MRLVSHVAYPMAFMGFRATRSEISSGLFLHKRHERQPGDYYDYLDELETLPRIKAVTRRQAISGTHERTEGSQPLDIGQYVPECIVDEVKRLRKADAQKAVAKAAAQRKRKAVQRKRKATQVTEKPDCIAQADNWDWFNQINGD